MALRAGLIEFLLAGVNDHSGNPLAAGVVTAFEAGTTNPASIYTTPTKSGATTSVTLDGHGMAQMYGDGAYKFVVKNAAGTTLYTFDNLDVYATVGTVTSYWGGTTNGTASAQTLTISDFPTSYSDGLRVQFRFGISVTGTTTLNINGIAAVEIVHEVGLTSLQSGDALSNSIGEVVYYSNKWRLRGMAASGTNVDITKISPSGTLTLGPGTANDIQFISGGANKFVWSHSGSALRGNTSDAVDLGSSTYLFRQVWSTKFYSSGSSMVVGTVDNQPGFLMSNNINRWAWDQSGNLSNDATNGGDLSLTKSGTYLKYNNVQISTPTATMSGATLTSQTNQIDWERNGAYYKFHLTSTGSVSSGNGSVLKFPAPAAGIGTAGSGGGGTCILVSASLTSGHGWWLYDSGTNTIDVTAPAIVPGNFGVGSWLVVIDGKYRAV